MEKLIGQWGLGDGKQLLAACESGRIGGMWSYCNAKTVQELFAAWKSGKFIENILT